MKVTFLKNHNGHKADETADLDDSLANYLIRTGVVEKTKSGKKDAPETEKVKDAKPAEKVNKSETVKEKKDITKPVTKKSK